MTRLRLLAVAIVLSTIGVGLPGAYAQAVIPQYQSPYPLMSPWLRLSQKNTGALDSYHDVVRPEMQLRQTLQQQAITNQQQADRLHGLHTQVAGLENADVMRPTGIYGGFMDYSHFYYSDIRSATGQSRQAATPRGVRRPTPGIAR